MARVNVLCLNVGSSSLTFALYPSGATSSQAHLSGGVDLSADRILRLRDAGGGTSVLDVEDPSDFPAVALKAFDAVRSRSTADIVVAHRIVHGGDRTAFAERVSAGVIADLDALTPLAPLHQQANLGPVRTLRRTRPDIVQVAVYDTAFHATLPDIARRLPLPDVEVTRGLRRYGFHGLSHAWVARHMADVAPDRRRVVSLHLSGGASACAILDGRSIDTTMGATPLDGLMMGTRSGSVDPGALLTLLTDRGLTVEALSRLLWQESGLAGVSGISNDLRVLLPSDDPAAERAIALYCRLAAKAVAGMAVSLGGLDALVFTGGIGAEQPEIRARICADLAWLGVALAPQEGIRGEILSPGSASIEVRAFAAQEERVMAQEAATLLATEDA